MAGTQPCSLASGNRLSADPHEAATGSLGRVASGSHDPDAPVCHSCISSSSTASPQTQDSRAQTLRSRTHVSWDTLQLSHSDLQRRLVGPPPPCPRGRGCEQRAPPNISHAFHSFAYMIAILPGCGATCWLENLVAQSSIETLVSLLSPVRCLFTPASFSI